MKKITFFISMMLFCCMQLYAQKNINLIISIDREIVVGSITAPRLIAVKKDGSRSEITADYYPGNFSISDADYKLAMDSSITVYLAFNYKENNYEFDLKKGWLKDYFYILYVYNTSKKEFRKLYTPPPGKNYVYEFDAPGGSTRLARNRK